MYSRNMTQIPREQTQAIQQMNNGMPEQKPMSITSKPESMQIAASQTIKQNSPQFPPF